MNFKKQIFAMAKQDPKTLVFPEASFSDCVMSAVKIITSKRLAKVILIGDPNVFFVRYNSFENDFLKIIDPKTSDLKTEVADKLLALNFDEKLTHESAMQLAEDPYYFATAMLLLDYADGLVSGSESISSKTYQPALKILQNNSKDAFISTGVLLIGKNKFLKNRPIMISDSSLNKSPTAKDIVNIAKNCVDFWKMLFIQEPKVAFLSYDTNSGENNDEFSSKIKTATKKFKELYPYVICDGEMQLDCAILQRSQEKKFANSQIKGDANILVAPDINAGNCLAKSLQYVGGLTAIGPVAFGFLKPICNLSRNATVEEIVLSSVVTAIQAQV